MAHTLSLRQEKVSINAIGSNTQESGESHQSIEKISNKLHTF